MKEEREDFIVIGFDEKIINKMSDEEIEKMCSYKDADDLGSYYLKMEEKYEEEEND